MGVKLDRSQNPRHLSWALGADSHCCSEMPLKIQVTTKDLLPGLTHLTPQSPGRWALIASPLVQVMEIKAGDIK